MAGSTMYKPIILSEITLKEIRDHWIYFFFLLSLTQNSTHDIFNFLASVIQTWDFGWWKIII